jgi:uncharacterized protein (TIGR00288 family)
MNPNPRVALLIDADNVSTDVIEQAISRLHAEYGALHVRRAYGTAEAAVKHQALFKRLSIRPMVNLAAGKNSTDIALAVDAIDLVVSERPDVVVIASSDSDFAPLVSRLREKGALVRGIGQKGKVGDETPLIYDDWLEFEHRRPRSRAAGGAADSDDGPGTAAGAKKARSRSRARAVDTPVPVEPAAAAPAAVEAPAAKRARKTPARKAAAAKSEAPPAEVATTPTPVKKARKAPARKSAAVAEPTSASAASAAAPAKPRARKTAKASTRTAAAAPAPAVPLPDKVARALEALPALAAGQAVNVQVAAEVLRKARVFSNADSWPKFFQRHADWFELLPPDRPSQVRRKAP